eukprot:Skav235259  [mRNA]  locus=scaffold874:90336:100692:+ [translate_table: standard]
MATFIGRDGETLETSWNILQFSELSNLTIFDLPRLDKALRFRGSPRHLTVHMICIQTDHNYLDLSAAFLTAGCTLLLMGGLSLSKAVVNFMTLAKVLLVIFMVICGFAGASVAKLVFLIFVSAMSAGYINWKGILALALKGETPEVHYCIFGAVVTLMMVSLTIHLACRYRQVQEEDQEEIFHAPCVPFIPVLAIYINATLMADIEWKDHLVLLIMLAAWLLLYLLYPCLARAKSLQGRQPSHLAVGFHNTVPHVSATTCEKKNEEKIRRG